MPTSNISLPQEQLIEFCQRWQIRELALFGSVLRDDFQPDSDIDILITFAPEAKHGAFALAQLCSVCYYHYRFSGMLRAARHDRPCPTEASWRWASSR